MNQSQKMLLLQFSEVEELISKTRGDVYSDNSKAIYHDNLIKLFDGIKAQNLNYIERYAISVNLHIFPSSSASSSVTN